MLDMSTGDAYYIGHLISHTWFRPILELYKFFLMTIDLILPHLSCCEYLEHFYKKNFYCRCIQVFH